MSRILHVSEAWGGGIVTAIEWLVEQALASAPRQVFSSAAVLAITRPARSGSRSETARAK